MNKTDRYLLFSLAGIMISIVFGIVIFILINNNAPQAQQDAITPTPMPASYGVTYEPTKAALLAKYLTEKTPLSASDSAVKASLLNLLNGYPSGNIYTSPKLHIMYLQESDSFLIEIYAQDIPQAKVEATAWFRGQGLSQQGICDLPAIFSVHESVIPEQGILFNPLAEGC